MFEQLARIRSLHIRLDESLCRLINNWTPGPFCATLLEHLSIKLQLTQNAKVLSAMQLPRLTSLYAFNGSLPQVRALARTTLTTLHLSNTEGSTPSDLVDLLGTLPALRELFSLNTARLWQGDVVHPPAEFAPPQHLTYLPNLQMLKIGDLHVGGVIILLHLEFTATAKVRSA